MDIRFTSPNGQDLNQYLEGVEDQHLEKGNIFKSGGKHFEVMSAEAGEAGLDVEVREIKPAFHRTLFLLVVLTGTWYGIQYAISLMQ